MNELAGKQGTVLIFTSIECPIANGYVPTLNELYRTYQPQGLHLIAVNPNAGQQQGEIVKHAEEYKCQYPTYQDPQARLAEQLSVTVCPTAVVYDGKGSLVYRGRIDDRYSRRGSGPNHRYHQDVGATAGSPAGRGRMGKQGFPRRGGEIEKPYKIHQITLAAPRLRC